MKNLWKLVPRMFRFRFLTSSIFDEMCVFCFVAQMTMLTVHYSPNKLAEVSEWQNEQVIFANWFFVSFSFSSRNNKTEIWDEQFTIFIWTERVNRVTNAKEVHTLTFEFFIFILFHFRFDSIFEPEYFRYFTSVKFWHSMLDEGTNDKRQCA